MICQALHEQLQTSSSIFCFGVFHVESFSFVLRSSIQGQVGEATNMVLMRIIHRVQPRLRSFTVACKHKFTTTIRTRRTWHRHQRLHHQKTCSFKYFVALLTPLSISIDEYSASNLSAWCKLIERESPGLGDHGAQARISGSENNSSSSICVVSCWCFFSLSSTWFVN